MIQINAITNQILLNSKNPQNTNNRHIEIIILTKNTSDTLYQYFNQHKNKIIQPLIQKLNKQQILSQRTH